MKPGDWNTFGWEGVRFKKPSDWELSNVEGNSKKGYAVLDDGARCRLQLRWQQPGKTVDLDGIAKRQSGMLKKKAGHAVSASETSDLKTGTFEGKKLRFVSDGDETLYGMLQCRQCMRVVLIGIFGSAKENEPARFGKIVDSLEDHAANGLNMWSVFGFTFNVPRDLVLRTHSLKSGDLTFEFAGPGGQFIFHRFSVANMLLKNKSFKSWFMDFAAVRYPGTRITTLRDLQGPHAHALLRAAGRKKRGVRFFDRKIMNACFWVCEEVNGILGVAEITGKGKSRLDELAKGVVCHA